MVLLTPSTSGVTETTVFKISGLAEVMVASSFCDGYEVAPGAPEYTTEAVLTSSVSNSVAGSRLQFRVTKAVSVLNGAPGVPSLPANGLLRDKPVVMLPVVGMGVPVPSVTDATVQASSPGTAGSVMTTSNA